MAKRRMLFENKQQEKLDPFFFIWAIAAYGSGES